MSSNFTSKMFFGDSKFDFLGNWEEIVEAKLFEKDPCAFIASKFYNNEYDYNFDFFRQSNLKHSVNPEGNRRRNIAKKALVIIANPDYETVMTDEVNQMVNFIKSMCHIN